MERGKLRLVYGLLVVMGFALWSCSSDDPQPVVALKSVTIVPYDNAVGYTCKGTYTSSTLTNSEDLVAIDVTQTELQKATLTANTTLGIGTKAYYNGNEIGSEGVTVDATQPIQIEVRGYNQTKTYTVNVAQATTVDENALVTIKSTDMRKMGIDSKVCDYTIACYNGKFYCFTSGLNDATAQYKLYTSENGVKWNEVTYAPHSLGAVGGLGAKAIVFNNRLYVLGGARTLGTDEWGTAAETSWGAATISWWRSFSTNDGQTFKCDTVGCTGAWKTVYGTKSNPLLPKACVFPNVTVLDGKMYMINSCGFVFGSVAGNSNRRITSDGIDWDATSFPYLSTVTNRLQNAFFSFKGKLWCVGGFTNYISTSRDYAQTAVYSSSDGGLTWTKEADDAGIGHMWGMTPVCGDNAVYLVGGEYIDNAKRVLSDKIYRSTDCIHWEAISTGSKYTARRLPQVAVKDGYAYIFGGYTTPSTKSYGYDLTTVPAFDTYFFKLQ
jgi:hypothetical protein